MPQHQPPTQQHHPLAVPSVPANNTNIGSVKQTRALYSLYCTPTSSLEAELCSHSTTPLTTNRRPIYTQDNVISPPPPTSQTGKDAWVDGIYSRREWIATYIPTHAQARTHTDSSYEVSFHFEAGNIDIRRETKYTCAQSHRSNTSSIHKTSQL